MFADGAEQQGRASKRARQSASSPDQLQSVGFLHSTLVMEGTGPSAGSALLVLAGAAQEAAMSLVARGLHL